MDLFSLLALSALVLLPIVFLVGFVGCGFQQGLLSTPAAPTNLTATATGPTEIQLTWTDNASDSTHFRLTRGDVTVNDNIPATNPQPYSDTGLMAGQTYEYQVFAVAGTAESTGSNFASANTPTTVPTPTWKRTFTQGPSATVGANTVGLGNRTLVQRIGAALFEISGPRIRITFRAGGSNALQLDAVFVSLPAPVGQPWDSAAPLVPVRF